MGIWKNMLEADKAKREFAKTPEGRIQKLKAEIAKLEKQAKQKAKDAKWAGFLGGASSREAQSLYAQAQIKQNEILMIMAEMKERN